MEPTPLKKLRYKKGWRLIHVYKELIRLKTPISWPTLIKIDNGYTTAWDGQKIMGKIKKKYTPGKKALQKLSKLTGIKSSKIYAHRHDE